jgi:hypothetical protein
MDRCKQDKDRRTGRLADRRIHMDTHRGERERERGREGEGDRERRKREREKGKGIERGRKGEIGRCRDR